MNATSDQVRICDRMYSCHDGLSRLFGDKFAEKIAQPVAMVRAVMQQRRVSAVKATLELSEAAAAKDPWGSAHIVMWLMAACVEIVEGPGGGRSCA